MGTDKEICQEKTRDADCRSPLRDSRMVVNLHKEYEINIKMGVCVDMYAHLVL